MLSMMMIFRSKETSDRRKGSARALPCIFKGITARVGGAVHASVNLNTSKKYSGYGRYLSKLDEEVHLMERRMESVLIH